MKREENIENVMRGFAEALVNGETERAVSFFAEDAVWYTPNGKFNGKDEIHNYIEWMKETIRDEQITGTGIDIIVKDDVGIYEHIIGGKSKGKPWKTMALCVYIVEAEKIKHVTMVYDRLDIAQQVTTGLARTAVGNIVREMEKGLHRGRV